jgi:hypothetical protein
MILSAGTRSDRAGGRGASGIRATARLLLVSIGPLTLDSCVSTEVVRVATGPVETASLEVKVFESVSDSKKDVLSQRTLALKLFDDRQSKTVPVREGTGNAWTADRLAPGRYRIQVAWGPKPGDKSGNSAGSDRDTLQLGPGEKAQARIVLSKFPTAAVVGVGLGALGVALAILAIDNSFKHMFGNSQSTRFEWSTTAAPARNAAESGRVR